LRVLALDFDGVISDSAPECFVVALRAYCALSRDEGWGVPATLLSRALAAVSADSGPTPEGVSALPMYARFLELMPLGNRAEDFAVLLRAIEENTVLVDQPAYDRWRTQQPAEFLAAFHRRLYSERAAWCEADFEGWNAMMTPYPDLLSLLRRRSGDAVLALATAKDRRSVGILLRRYGVADLFREEFLLDKEAGVSKRGHLQALQQRTGCRFEDITFVDDKVNHLDDVASLGVRCVLAEWGYNSTREHEQAHDRGYAVCTLAAAEDVLFGSEGNSI
jgi:phosphoglycolate phosphatase-like HAD superfamily hydrolase